MPTMRQQIAADEAAYYRTPAGLREIKAEIVRRRNAEYDAVLASHPEIGELTRNGVRVFYVVRNGLYHEAADPSVLVA